jgi:hypothetical protein
MNIKRIEIKDYRHPKEMPRFLLAITFVAPMTMLILLLFFYLVFFNPILVLIAPSIWLGVWITRRTLAAALLGNMVRATDRSYPEVLAALNEAKARFGYGKAVDAFIHDDGSFNAFVVPMFSRKALLINSELLKPANSQDELRFIVGRFVGALAARHYRLRWVQPLLNMIENAVLFNILLAPYERAVVYSGDRMGLALVDGNIDAAVSALMKCVVGTEIAGRADVGSYREQADALRGSFFSWLARAYAFFPHHTHRVDDLIGFATARSGAQAQSALSGVAAVEPGARLAAT